MKRRICVRPAPSHSGVPDSLAIDNEGYVWKACWDGACMIRNSPDGQIDCIVNVPVPRPIGCAFGGPNLGTLYVSSVRACLSDTQLAEAP